MTISSQQINIDILLLFYFKSFQFLYCQKGVLYKK